MGFIGFVGVTSLAGSSPPDYCSGPGFVTAVTAGGTVDLTQCTAPVNIDIGNQEITVTHDTTVEYTVPVRRHARFHRRQRADAHL